MKSYAFQGEESFTKDTLAIYNMLQEAKEKYLGTNRKAFDSIAKIAIKKSEKINYLPGLSDGYNFMGINEFYNGNFIKAIAIYNKALAYALKSENREDLSCKIYGNLAGSSLQIGEYNKTIDYYFKSLSLKNGTILSKISSYQGLGEVYFLFKQYRKSVEYYNKSLELSESIQQYNRMVYNACHLGWAYLEMGNRDEARKHFLYSRLFIDKVEADIFKCFYYERIADYHYRSENKDTALRKIETSLNIAIDGNITNKLPSIYIIKGKILKDQGKAIKAEELFLKSYRLASEMRLTVVQIEAAFELFKFYNEKSEFKKAAFFANKHIDLYKKQEENIRIERTINLENQFLKEKQGKEQIIKQLETKNDENELLKKVTRYNSIIVSTIVIISVLIVIVIRGYLRQKIKAEELETIKSQQQISNLTNLIRGEENERERIAYEFHDEVNGDLAAIKFFLEGLDLQKEKNIENRNKLSSLIDDLIKTVRIISQNLMLPTLVNYNLFESIEQLRVNIRKQYAIDIEMEVYGSPPSLEKNKQVSIYRIVQELFNNIIKHTNTSYLFIQLINNNNTLTIIIEGNATKHNEIDNKQRRSLTYIESRIAYLKADFETRTDKLGTTSTMIIDLNKKPHD